MLILKELQIVLSGKKNSTHTKSIIILYNVNGHMHKNCGKIHKKPSAKITGEGPSTFHIIASVLLIPNSCQLQTSYKICLLSFPACSLFNLENSH